MGAKPELKDGLPKQNEASELDKLRKRLLGKRVTTLPRDKLVSNSASRNPQNTAKSYSEQRQGLLDNDSADDEGRSSAIKSMKTRRGNKLAHRDGQQDKQKAIDQHPEAPTSTEMTSSSSQVVGRSGKRKPSSFLDEVLAGKTRKKGKKNRETLKT